MHLKENEPLAPLTTFGIGGTARWFVEAQSEDEIVEASAWARDRGIPLFVLGGGSNLLISDAGYPGLVLHIALRGITSFELPPTPDLPAQRIYQAAAGESWDHCVEQTLGANCAGVECLAGIPGTVGGTPVQNVGAYGQEVATVIERVRAYDLCECEFVEFNAAECAFSYRRSRFNTTDRGRYLITCVDYRLAVGGPVALRYPELYRALMDDRKEGEMPSPAEVAAAVRRIRQNKGMLLVEGDPNCRSAGSFFKNPVIADEHFRNIAARSADFPRTFPAGPGLVKLPAAWLIENAGFYKGYRLGKAGISRRHTLALVNYGDADQGGASAGEILALANEISIAVENKFGIRLEREPVLVGF
jgi:UDP-N-acetylmuramate dehydrogenase